MQTAEKLTPSFLIKLALLSVLIVFGVMIKTPKDSTSTDIRKITDFVVPATAKDQDSLQLQKPHYHFAKYRSSSI